MRQLLRQTFEDNKGILALGGAFMLGTSLALSLVGFTTRLSAVEEARIGNSERIDRVEAVVESLADNVTDLTYSVCLLTKVAQEANVLECNRIQP